MRSSGLIAAALTLVTSADVAGGDVPRGRRVVVAPTHAVVEETVCATGAAAIQVLQGASVALQSRPRAGGAAKVRLVGEVEATCDIDAAALGKWVAVDTAIDGGRVYEGALVRVLSDGATRGTLRVESAGEVRKTFELPADALTAESRAFLYRPPATRHFVTPYEDTKLYPKAVSVGTNAEPVAVIDGGVEVALIEQQDATALVRTHGPVEIEGWALNKQFADRGAEASPRLLVPTHEVFTGVDFYGSASGGKPFARLRGGALVEVNKLESGRAKVTSTGDVIASGWVDVRGLRELARPGQ